MLDERKREQKIGKIEEWVRRNWASSKTSTALTS